MKKFICALVSVFCLLPFGLTACSNSSSDNGIIDLAECEIGYELPVYPNCEFDYKLSDGTIFHINKIELTLSAKNEINEGDVLTSAYYPYTLTLSAAATVEPSEEILSVLAEEDYAYNFTILFTFMPEYMTTGATAPLEKDYTIAWEKTLSVFSAEEIYFLRIS